MNKKIYYLISLLPLFITAIMIKVLPDQIAMHFDASGNVDRYGSKYESFLVCAMIVGMAILFDIVIYALNKKIRNASEDKEIQHTKANIKVTVVLAYGTILMFSFIQYYVLYLACKGIDNSNLENDIEKMYTGIMVLLGVFIIVLGNYAPKIKYNSLLGLRTIWSKHNEQTWAASQRSGGKIFMLTGLLVIIESIIFDALYVVYVGIVIIMVMTVIAIIATYIAYSKYKDKD